LDTVGVCGSALPPAEFQCRLPGIACLLMEAVVCVHVAELFQGVDLFVLSHNPDRRHIGPGLATPYPADR
jgi:hypothetical protein